jgi:hypothetical protein
MTPPLAAMTQSVKAKISAHVVYSGARDPQKMNRELKQWVKDLSIKVSRHAARLNQAFKLKNQ